MKVPSSNLGGGSLGIVALYSYQRDTIICMNPNSSSPKKVSIAFLIIAFAILLGVSLVFLFMKDRLFPTSSLGPQSSVDQEKTMEQAYGAKASSSLSVQQQAALEKGVSVKNAPVSSSKQQSDLQSGYGKK